MEMVKGESQRGRRELSRWVSVGCFKADPSLELTIVTTVTTTATIITTTTEEGATVTLTSTVSTTTTSLTSTTTSTVTTPIPTTTKVNCSDVRNGNLSGCIGRKGGSGFSNSSRLTAAERLAAAIAAASQLRSSTTTTTTTTQPAAMDPVQCSRICEFVGRPVAALRGMECFCLDHRRGFTLADQPKCDNACAVQYFNATAKFCGGTDDHYSLYQEYDFMHSGAQGCLDPWRRVWYQSVAIERFAFNASTGRSQWAGYDWHLQAISMETGDPLFPYSQALEGMLVGLHYDLDESRIVGLGLPSWAGKAPQARWEPSVLALYMNSLRPAHVIFNASRVLVDMTDNEAAGLSEQPRLDPGLDFLMGSSLSAFDTKNNVYYVALPDLPMLGEADDSQSAPIYEFTNFSVRILAVNINGGIPDRGRVILDQRIPFRVGLLEVNSAYHELLALVLDGDADEWSYISLGRSNRSTDWGPHVDFNWTFTGIAQAASGDNSAYGNKTCQVGVTAIDHWSNTSLFTMADDSNSGTPLQVLDVRTDKPFNFTGPDPASQTRLEALVPFGVQAAWIMNTHPIVPYLPYPMAIDARFSMDGLKVTVRWPAYTYAGIRPVDNDGDSIPDFIDWSPRQIGPRNCMDMLSYLTSLYLGSQTWCEWSNAVLPLSSFVINMPTVDTLFLGDVLIFRNDTIFTYLPSSGEISLFSIGQIPVIKPDPLTPPIIKLDFRASSTPFEPINEEALTTDPSSVGKASLCQRGELDAGKSWDHGGMPEWTWTLTEVICNSILGVQFEPNSFLKAEIEKRLSESTVGDAYWPEGNHLVQLPRDELEPGCVYKMSLRLFSRWEKESNMVLQVTKLAPLGAINWMPPCPYFCNPATCEPPSTCNPQGVCVCAPGTFGTFCSGMCPTCSRRGSLGCDDGRFGSGTCICRLGYDGDLCRQRLEWRDHEFGPCEGQCNSEIGFQTRIMKCTNVETDVVVNASQCPPSRPPETKPCVPKLCDCGLPPAVQGIDPETLAAFCPETLSGGTCRVSCGEEYTTIGSYRCYAGRFVSVPQCTPTGGSLEALPAVAVVLTLMLDAAAAGADLQGYVEENMGEQLRGAFVDYLSGAGIAGVVPSGITLIVAVAGGQATRRLAADPVGIAEPAAVQVNASLPLRTPDAGGGQAPGRRLSGATRLLVEITLLVALGSAEEQKLTEAALQELQKRNAMTPFLERLQRTLGSDGSAQAGSMALSAPVLTQVYIPLNSTLFNETAAAGSRPPQRVTVTLAPPQEAASAGEWAAGLSIGFGSGAVLVVVVGSIAALLWQQKKRRDLARTAPASDKLHAAHSEERLVVAAPTHLVRRVSLGSGGSAAPSPGASPRSIAELSPSPTPLGSQVGSSRMGFMLEQPGGGGAQERRRSRSASLVCGEDQNALTGPVEWTWEDGTAYKGQVAEGVLHGEGRILWPNGKSYIGQWQEGEFHGRGMLRASAEKGWVYNGQFRHGECHGLGRCEWAERGAWYDGEWSDGWQCGLGEAGVMRNLAWSAKGALPPVKCNIYRMQGGQRQDNLGESKIGGDLGSIITVELRATEADQQQAMADRPFLEEGLCSDLQLVSPLWGLAFGHPEKWLPGRWGALLLTGILPGGALEHWNRASETQRQLGGPIQVNSLIWRVNDVVNDPRRMVEELYRCEGQRKVTLGVRLPPSSRFSEFRSNRPRRRSWRSPRAAASSAKSWRHRSGNEAAPALAEQTRLPSDSIRLPPDSRGRDLRRAARAQAGPLEESARSSGQALQAVPLPEARPGNLRQMLQAAPPESAASSSQEVVPALPLQASAGSSRGAVQAVPSGAASSSSRRTVQVEARTRSSFPAAPVVLPRGSSTDILRQSSKGSQAGRVVLRPLANAPRPPRQVPLRTRPRPPNVELLAQEAAFRMPPPTSMPRRPSPPSRPPRLPRQPNS